MKTLIGLCCTKYENLQSRQFNTGKFFFTHEKDGQEVTSLLHPLPPAAPPSGRLPHIPHFPEQEAQCCSDCYLEVSRPNSIRTSVASHCELEFHVTLVLFFDQ